MRERLAVRLRQREPRTAVPAGIGADVLDQAGAREAAVLVPLVDHADEMTVLLTHRAEHLSQHPGQISFPGGRIEPSDADPVAAALRESEEEVGLDPARVEVLGTLDTCITGTGFRVVPVVGIITPPLALTLDAGEVAGAFEMPLSFALERGNYRRQSATFRNRRREFYVLDYRDHYIWGATARMLVNLAEIAAE